MQIPPFRLVRHSVAYLLGAFLIGWGLWCFGYMLLYPAQAAKESVAANQAFVLYAPNMFAGVIICWGVILFLTPRFDYVSGTLIIFGSIMSGFALIFLAYWLGDLWGQVPIRGVFQVTVILTFIFLLGTGSSVAGFIWFRRKRRGPPPMPINMPT